MQTIKIKKGLNIPLDGKAQAVIEKMVQPAYVTIKPSDFIGFIPKPVVKEGDRVLAGTALLINKQNESLIVTSPVSGVVDEIVRGDKRLLLGVKIKADKETEYIRFKESGSIPNSAETVKEILLNSGAWAYIRQRPYDIIASPDVLPRDVYVSTFDSAPLAPDYSLILKGKENYIQAAVDALDLLTSAKIHFGIDVQNKEKGIFENIKNVEFHYFAGTHPAGNTGVQIHHTKPLNKGEIIWYINIQDMVTIGKLLLEGVYDASRIIAITGPQAEKTFYANTYPGASIDGLVSIKNNNKQTRIISGNVLTGYKIPENGYLGFYHHQLSLVEEGNHSEFLGWAMPGLKKFSNSNLFPSKLLGNKFRFHTNFNGSERAFVMSGQYEKVFPFDIYPVYLIKAILAQDIELMEELGIYEISPEDFALCEFVCTSKIEVQDIVAKGLELLRKEMS